MALTLTSDQIEAFLHNCHPIPVSKGMLGDWLSDNAEGMASDRLMSALREAGAVVPSDTHVSGWRVATGVTQVHLNDIP